MPALRTFHPCAFNFRDTNIRRVGSVTDGGTSLSGIAEKNESDGGGYLQADFANGKTRTKEQGNHWRGIMDYLGGGEVAVIVLLCAERLFQPVGALGRVTHGDDTTFDDDTEYTSGGADYALVSTDNGDDDGLGATIMTISGVSEKPLIGGELFSILHPLWGWRAYRVNHVDGNTIRFLPPLRDAAAPGTSLEFDTPRCQMVLAQASDNPTENGRFTACAAVFVEDMRQPAEDG